MMPPFPPLQAQVDRVKAEPLQKPCATVYVQNLNERIKIADIKDSLFQLFSNVGEVHEVHAKKNIKMRGQAFVVAADEEAAETMIKDLRGHMFYGKPLRLNFAKDDSDFNAKMKGTFDATVSKKREVMNQEFVKIRDQKAKRKIIDKVIQLRRQSHQSLSGGDSALNPGRTMHGGPTLFAGQPEKYKILFIERLPKNGVAVEQLEDIFEKYNGFVEVRMIAEKGLAFVEYLNDDYAAFALQDVKATSNLVFDDAETATKVEAKINFGKR